MKLMELGNATFIALETFRKNGDGIITPVWVTGEKDKLYVWTNLESWKVKRIQNNNHIRICESDARGNPKSEWLDATAQVLDSDNALKKTKSLFRSKYGIQFRMFSLMGRKRPKTVLEISTI